MSNPHGAVSGKDGIPNLVEQLVGAGEPRTKNRVVEMMTRIHFPLIGGKETGGVTLRVWSECDPYNPTMGPDPTIEGVLNPSMGGLMMLLSGLHKLAFIHPITAYEVLDRDGNGIVVYPDWK